MKCALLVLSLVLPVTIRSQTADSEIFFRTFTRNQLNTAIAQCNSEVTRMAGLQKLIRMAGFRLYEGSFIGSLATDTPELFEMRGKAAKAVSVCRDVDTVRKALDSPDRQLRLWAILSFGFGTPPNNLDVWGPLVPKLIEKLSDSDIGIRSSAVDKLWSYPDGARAIADHAREETSPEVLLRVARSGSTPEFYNSLNRLLSSKDPAVRRPALEFIYYNLWNSAIASMWKMGFNQEIYDHVRMLCYSGLPEEKEMAEKTLKQLDLIKVSPQ